MKTFLWVEDEYELIAVNAETLEQAIELGKAEVEAAFKIELAIKIEFYKERKDVGFQPPALEKYCREAADHRLRQFTGEPVVLEIGQAKIIYHANE